MPLVGSPAARRRDGRRHARRGRDLGRALRAAPRLERDAPRALRAVALGRLDVTLEQPQEAGDRQHDHEVDDGRRDDERDHRGEERTVLEVRADELFDQGAELRSDHDRDGQIDQVPAQDEFPETTHERKLPSKTDMYVLLPTRPDVTRHGRPAHHRSGVTLPATPTSSVRACLECRSLLLGAQAAEALGSGWWSLSPTSPLWWPG